MKYFDYKLNFIVSEEYFEHAQSMFKSIPETLSSKQKIELTNQILKTFMTFSTSQGTAISEELLSQEESQASQQLREEVVWENTNDSSVDKQAEVDVISLSSSESQVERSSDSQVDKARPRHNNKVGLKDHSLRVDVRGKSFLRNLVKVVKLHFLNEVKGSGRWDKMFKLLRNMLEEQYVDLRNNSELFFQVYSPILYMILRKKNDNITKSKYFTSEEKQRILAEIKAFKLVCDDFSIAKNRSQLFKHSIIRLSKTLVYKNEIYNKRFWKRVLDTRRKEITFVDQYKKHFEMDLEQVKMIN